MSVVISAVICTHNRPYYLANAIASLHRQTLSRMHYEIIVIDNCSTDSTKEIVEKSSAANLRYLFESRLGLSHARNTGWQNARGKYVAYLDDDAVAAPGWLEKIIEVFETVRPTPGCVGGKTEPEWEAPRPPWLGDPLLDVLTVVDWSETPRALKDLSTEWLVGANIAFPTALLERFGGFPSRLGRRGRHLLTSEDVFLEKQIVKTGYSCFYHPDIAVRHHIHKSRLEKGWFLRRYYWQGVSNAVMHMLEEKLSGRQRFISAACQTRSLFGSPAQLLNLLLPTDDPERFSRKCFTLITVGHLFGLLRMSTYED